MTDVPSLCLLSAVAWPTWWMSAAAAVLVGLALALLLPGKNRPWRFIGAALGAVSLGLFGFEVVRITDPLWDGIYLAIAATTVVSAVGAVTMRSPVYCAIWFALALLGTAGLFLVQGAQFLSVATMVVYAGAILVTFLFVLMLSQPRGSAPYDRVAWEAWTSAMTGALLLGVLTATLFKADKPASGSGWMPPPSNAGVSREEEILHPEHMARLGGVLFGRHLLAVEAAGTLLLAALVGAVAILTPKAPTPAARGSVRHG